MPSYAVRDDVEYAPDTGRGMAFLALLLGIVSLVAWVFFGLSILTGLLAIGLGVVARRRAAAAGTGSGMATTAIVLGVLGLLMGVLYWALLKELVAQELACRSTPDAPTCVS